MAEPTTQPTAPVPGPEPVPYQALCLPAIAALILSLLYAAVVIIGGLASFLTGTPLLLGAWTLILPGAALALAYFATTRIAQSDGTLTGGTLARYATLVSLFVGFGYWAYYAATYFAVAQQADTFARNFLERLIKGDTDGAFLLTLRPTDRRMDEKNFRNELEVRHNQFTDTGGPGPLSGFNQTEMVRMLRLGGDQTRLISRGVSSWEYSGGGYHVVLGYGVDAPWGGFELAVTVQGTETRQGESRERDWYVSIQGTGPSREALRRLTPEGENILTRSFAGRTAAESWLGSIVAGHSDLAYLMTLPVEERKKVRAKYPDSLVTHARLISLSNLLSIPVQGGMPSAAFPAMATYDRDLLRQVYLPGYTEFLKGSLVEGDDAAFWAPDKARRAELLALTRTLLRGYVEERGIMWNIDPINAPLAEIKDGKFLMKADTSIKIYATRMAIEGHVHLEGDATGDPRANTDLWRIVKITLNRGKTMPNPADGPGGP